MLKKKLPTIRIEILLTIILGLFVLNSCVLATPIPPTPTPTITFTPLPTATPTPQITPTPKPSQDLTTGCREWINKLGRSHKSNFPLMESHKSNTILKVSDRMNLLEISDLQPHLNKFGFAIPYEGFLAQSSTYCNAVVATFNSVLDRCSEINTGWVCYANPTVIVSPAELRFQRPGDRVPISEINTLYTCDEGIAVMRLQASPGQDPLTIVAFGDAPTESEHVFALSATGNGFLCQSAPPGMVIRTETGESGKVTINGLEIDLN